MVIYTKAGLNYAQEPPLYHYLQGGINILGFFLPRLPVPRHQRRDRARRWVAELMGRILCERRRARREPDFMQVFMEACYADGRSLRDEEITGLLLTALFAGQHTSGVLAAWVGIDLLRQLVSPPPAPDHGSWVTGPRPPCRVRYRRRPIPLSGGL